MVYSLIIGVIPGTLGNIHYPGHDTVADPGRDYHLAPFIENPNQDSILNASSPGIGGIEQYRLRQQLIYPGHVMELRMSAPLEMRGDELERIFLG